MGERPLKILYRLSPSFLSIRNIMGKGLEIG